MLRRLSNNKVGMLGLSLTAALFAFAGCNKTDTPADNGAQSAGGKSAGGAGNTASPGGGNSGRDLFAANCRCHNGGKAPDLSREGSKPEHTAGWIAEYASNPKSKDPGSRMSPMQGKVSSEDLRTISTYLASQK